MDDEDVTPINSPVRVDKSKNVLQNIDTNSNDSIGSLLQGPSSYQSKKILDTMIALGQEADTQLLDENSLFSQQLDAQHKENKSVADKPESNLGNTHDSPIEWSEPEERVHKGKKEQAQKVKPSKSKEQEKEKILELENSPSQVAEEDSTRKKSQSKSLSNLKPINKRSRKPKPATEDNMLDAILGEPQTSNPAPGSRGSPKRVIPCSTPLRKTADTLLPGSMDNFASPKPLHNTSILARSNDLRDSGFPGDSNAVFNSTASTIRPQAQDVNSSMCSTVIPELNSSYYQNIRLLIQWKHRTLLVPVPK